MIRLSRLFKDYKESGAFSSLVNLHGFIDERAFLTKSGGIGLVLRIEGIEYECLDPEQLDQASRRICSNCAVMRAQTTGRYAMPADSTSGDPSYCHRKKCGRSP